MSDFIKPVPPESESKGSRRRQWLLFGLLVLVVVIAFLIFLLVGTTTFDGLLRSLRYMGKNDGDYGRASFDGYGVTGYAMIDGGLAIAGQGGVTIFEENGDTAAKLQRDLSTPVLLSSEESLLVWDVGGKYWATMDETGEITVEMTTSGEILDGDLADNGYTSILHTGEDSRATLEIFNEDGTLLYRRNAKSHYLNACAISPDGRYAAAVALGQEELSFVSRGEIYRTDKEEIFAELPLGSQMIYDLAFIDSDTLCAVGEQSVLLFSIEGELLREYYPDNGRITGYAFGGEGFVVLALELYQTGERYRIITLEANGDVGGAVHTEDAPLHISAQGDYVSVMTARQFGIYNAQMKAQNDTPNENGYLRGLVRSDGTALLIGSGEVALYIP